MKRHSLIESHLLRSSFSKLAMRVKLIVESLSLTSHMVKSLPSRRQAIVDGRLATSEDGCIVDHATDNCSSNRSSNCAPKVC